MINSTTIFARITDCSLNRYLKYIVLIASGKMQMIETAKSALSLSQVLETYGRCYFAAKGK